MDTEETIIPADWEAIYPKSDYYLSTILKFE